MTRTPVRTSSKARRRRVFRDKEMAALIGALTAEIEQLHEDNLQLRAAVEIYREIARRSASAAVR